MIPHLFALALKADQLGHLVGGGIDVFGGIGSALVVLRDRLKTRRFRLGWAIFIFAYGLMLGGAGIRQFYLAYAA